VLAWSSAQGRHYGRVGISPLMLIYLNGAQAARWEFSSVIPFSVRCLTLCVS
jgi:hypothetical protein